jgi:replicative DNA helicase
MAERRTKSAIVAGNRARGLPHSVEAEQGVIGSMLLAPKEAIDEATEKVDENYFYVPAHQKIFGEILKLWRRGQGIDLITFTQALRDENLLESVGGAAFVTNLFTFVPAASNVGYYLEIVQEKYILREAIAVCVEGAQRSYDEQDDVEGLISDLEAKILGIRRGVAKSHSTRELVMESIERIEASYERKGAVGGLTTGFSELDRTTDGLHKSDMIVIAARPSMGKTAFAMNVADHLAAGLGEPVGIFSLEMSAAQLMDRLIFSRARVNMQKVRDGFLREDDFDRISAAAAKLGDSPIYIDDEVTPVEILVAKMRRMKREHKIVLAVVDYLQLLRSSAKRPRDRQEEVSLISSQLKAAAKQLELPVIVLAQLNRGPEHRGGRPRLSDLRESGAIEQDADFVGLLLRPEVYAENEDEKADLEGQAELIIAKQRSGPTGVIHLTFLKEFTRFEDRARKCEGEMF